MRIPSRNGNEVPLLMSYLLEINKLPVASFPGPSPFRVVHESEGFVMEPTVFNRPQSSCHCELIIMSSYFPLTIPYMVNPKQSYKPLVTNRATLGRLLQNPFSSKAFRITEQSCVIILFMFQLSFSSLNCGLFFIFHVICWLKSQTY